MVSCLAPGARRVDFPRYLPVTKTADQARLVLNYLAGLPQLARFTGPRRRIRCCGRRQGSTPTRCGRRQGPAPPGPSYPHEHPVAVRPGHLTRRGHRIGSHCQRERHLNGALTSTGALATPVPPGQCRAPQEKACAGRPVTRSPPRRSRATEIPSLSASSTSLGAPHAAKEIPGSPPS